MSEDTKRRDEYDKKIQTLTAAGNSAETAKKVYSDWAKRYDEDIGEFGIYNGPLHVAGKMAKVLDKRSDARILDAGAGTGLVGIELKRLGFTNIDALEPVPAMLDEAKKKGIYKNFICDYLGTNKLNIADNTYDGLILSGVFVPGLADDSCFEEIIRTTKPGGYTIFIVHESYLSLPQLERLEPRIRSLEEQGQWKLISREIKEDYFNIDDKRSNGALFTLKITNK